MTTTDYHFTDGSVVTDRNVRTWLGHNGAECVVRIKRDGTLFRHGSPDVFDRSEDFWSNMGHRDEIAREIACWTTGQMKAD